MPRKALLDSAFRERLIHENLDLARKMARAMARSLPPLRLVDNNDLIQAAMVGLVDAANRCDPELADRFQNFATFKIRKAIVDELRLYDHVKRHVRKFVRDVSQAEEELWKHLHRQPTDMELATRIGMEQEEFVRRRSEWTAVIAMSLDGEKIVSVREGSSAYIVEQLKSKLPDAYEVLGKPDRLRVMREEIAKLPPDMRTIVERYYFSEAPVRYIDIAREIGLTESRVCQIHKLAMEELRHRLGRRSSEFDL
jgi:RNA polymerase sigma factor FliA